MSKDKAIDRVPSTLEHGANVEVQQLDLTVQDQLICGIANAIKASANSAAKKWFYESFEDELLADMQKAGLIRQAEGFSISIIATLQLDIEQAIDETVRTLRSQEHQSAPATLLFPTIPRKTWSDGEVQQWLDEQGPFYRHPPVTKPEAVEPVAYIQFGEAHFGEIDGYSIEPNRKVCDALNLADNGNGTVHDLFLAPPLPPAMNEALQLLEESRQFAKYLDCQFGGSPQARQYLAALDRMKVPGAEVDDA